MGEGEWKHYLNDEIICVKLTEKSLIQDVYM